LHACGCRHSASMCRQSITPEKPFLQRLTGMARIARSRSVTEQTTYELCGMCTQLDFHSAISVSYVLLSTEQPFWHRYCDTSPHDPPNTRGRMVHVTFDT